MRPRWAPGEWLPSLTWMPPHPPGVVPGLPRPVCRARFAAPDLPAIVLCSTLFFRAESRAATMLVVMQSHATEEQVRSVCDRIESLGLKAHPIPGSGRTAIGITGNSGAVDLGVLESMPGRSEE